MDGNYIGIVIPGSRQEPTSLPCVLPAAQKKSDSENHLDIGHGLGWCSLFDLGARIIFLYDTELKRKQGTVNEAAPVSLLPTLSTLHFALVCDVSQSSGLRLILCFLSGKNNKTLALDKGFTSHLQQHTTE